MVLTVDDNIGAYENVFSNFYSPSTIQNTVSIDARVVSNNQATWEINDYIFPYIYFFLLLMLPLICWHFCDVLL